MCEADERNRRALYLLNNEWGNGRININDMRRILTGEPDTCDNEGDQGVQPDQATTTP